MRFYYEEKKSDQGPISTALIVGAAIFLIVWFLRSLSTALAMGAAAALFTWVTSAWLQDSEPKITFQGASSTALFGASEGETKFQGKTLIPLVVGVTAAWGVWKLLGGKFLALIVGGVVAWGIFKWLQRLEKEERRKKRVEGALSSSLVFGAAALAAWGISKSFDGGSDGERSRDKEKIMKVPGRGYYMPRKDFEDSPSAYFRHLRRKE